MKMEDVLPYVGVVIVQLAQAGLMMAAKIAMANGMTTFTFTCYSNIFGSLILIPINLFIYRSNRPALLIAFLSGFFVLGSIGFAMQIIGMTGIKYASATLSVTILNLSPAFTFALAVILRMEKFNHKSATTIAKSIGTLLSIMGALMVTLYQGPSILGISESSNNPFDALTSSSTWVLGGSLLAIDSLIAAIFIITMALVLKRSPAELLLMLFYSAFIAILTASASLIVEKDLSAWSLKPTMRHIPVIYSALFGNVFQISITMWCVKRKGPLFVSIFHPLGVIFTMVMGIIVLGEALYLGSVLGSGVVVVGFYFVLWGKAKETKMEDDDEESDDNRMPLLHHNNHDGE